MKRSLLLSIACFLLIIACKTEPKEPISMSDEDRMEAREDSIELANAYAAQKEIDLSLHAIVETEIIKANIEDDAADDPAIWINAKDPNKSIVFGSNKTGGISLYDLEGKELEFMPVGKVNNIEVLYNFPLKNGTVDILGGTNRTTQSIDLYLIDTSMNMKRIGFLPVDSTTIDDIYGFCFAEYLKENKFYAMANGKNGTFEQYEMIGGQDTITMQLARRITFDDQVEGMVADAQYGSVFVGQEDYGIWKLSIDPNSEEKTLLSQSASQNNPKIRYDIEGLTLIKKGDHGYLVASSQGNFSYAVFDRTGDHDYITSFKVSDAEIDGTEETDGLVINTTPINETFPEGIIIIQDGFNYDGKEQKPQNFKYISAKELLDQLDH